MTLREVPVGAAAVYVPAGRAAYPSSVVMGVVTARSAGVLDVVRLRAARRRTARSIPVILGTCRLCGVRRVYRMGGAQAIAALTYGTESVQPVDVIVGPGNLWVQEAKHQLSAVVGIDGFAGPSDLLVVLGGGRRRARGQAGGAGHARRRESTAREASWPRSRPPSSSARRSPTPCSPWCWSAPRVGDATFAIAQVSTPREAIGLGNAFAPEHMQLIGADVEGLSHLVTCAGCLFVGVESATAFGDYVAGSNHVLPTAGAARFSSTLSARHFRRRMAEVRIGAAARETGRRRRSDRAIGGL